MLKNNVTLNVQMKYTMVTNGTEKHLADQEPLVNSKWQIQKWQVTGNLTG